MGLACRGEYLLYHGAVTLHHPAYYPSQYLFVYARLDFYGGADHTRCSHHFPTAAAVLTWSTSMAISAPVTCFPAARYKEALLSRFTMPVLVRSISRSRLKFP